MSYPITQAQLAYLCDIRLAFPHAVSLKLTEHGVNSVDALSSRQASDTIEHVISTIGARWGNRKPLKKYIIAQQALFEQGGTLDSDIFAAAEALRDGLGKIRGLTFEKNVGGSREPLSPDEQHEALVKEIKRHREVVAEKLGGREKAPEKPPEMTGDKDDDQPEEKPEKKPEKKPEDVRSQSQKDCEEIIQWIQGKLRPFCIDRAADGKPLDEIGLRPAENAAKMLRAGIRPVAIKHALTMHYPPEARRALDVKDYDVRTWKPVKFGDVKAPEGALEHHGKHQALPYAMALACAGVPLALVGPKGTGKTTLARHLAEELGLTFGFVSMTSGTSPSAFNGRPKIGGDGGVIQSQWEKIYKGGGVYLLDEMDASDENLLLLVNAALANGHFSNSATGELVARSPNFIPVAAMNTLGIGAGRDYNARNKLDAATLDRWNAGRVRVDLDEALESKIFWEIVTS